jgi:hypothetical protein
MIKNALMFMYEYARCIQMGKFQICNFLYCPLQYTHRYCPPPPPPPTVCSTVLYLH